ncbi:MAG: NrsF family protein [Novosphingobium sp.]
MPHPQDDLIAGLVDDLKPVEPLEQRRGMGWAMAALLGGALAMVLLRGPRPDLADGHPDAMFLISAGLFLVLALASAWAAVDMARPAVGSRRESWVWTALMAAVLPVSAIVVVTGNLSRGEDSGIHWGGLECMVYGLGWSLITAASLVAWLRRGAPSNPERAGLLAGVAAGSAGIFAVALQCPVNSLVHIGVWHGLTVVLAGIAGRFVLPPLLRW